ncbi:MAG: hypothetical protein ACYDCC_07240 [Actinomycetota bacterium]
MFVFHGHAIRRLARLVTLGTLLAMLFAVGGFATGQSVAAQAGVGLCQGTVLPNQFQPPTGSTLVVDVVMITQNDEDSGNVGYWALDNYPKHVQVWQSGSSFYVDVLYAGTWQTFAGALSPGSGVAETQDATGPFFGGYVATLTGSMLAKPTQSAFGVLGPYDFGGTKADVMKGTYGNGQTGPTNVVEWADFYFPSSTIATFNFLQWGWEYRYQTQAWCNNSTGTTGDIVT